MRGLVWPKGNRLIPVGDLIQEQTEDLTRFVMQMLQIGDPVNIWKMDAYEFHRDVLRAQRIAEARKKQYDDG